MGFLVGRLVLLLTLVAQSLFHSLFLSDILCNLLSTLARFSLFAFALYTLLFGFYLRSQALKTA